MAGERPAQSGPARPRARPPPLRRSAARRSRSSSAPGAAAASRPLSRPELFVPGLRLCSVPARAPVPDLTPAGRLFLKPGAQQRFAFSAGLALPSACAPL